MLKSTIKIILGIGLYLFANMALAAPEVLKVAPVENKVQAPQPPKPKNQQKVIIKETPETFTPAELPKPAKAGANKFKGSYQLIEQGVFKNRVSVPIPSNFENATEAFIKEKFPDPATYPKIVLTDKTKRAILSMNLTPNQGDRESIVRFFRDVKNDIRTRYPSSLFLQSDVIKNHTLALIEVVLPNKDGKKLYNVMAFRYVGDDFFFLNFTCPEEDMLLWQDTAREIAQNIKLL